MRRFINFLTKFFACWIGALAGYGISTMINRNCFTWLGITAAIGLFVSGALYVADIIDNLHDQNKK